MEPRPIHLWGRNAFLGRSGPNNVIVHGTTHAERGGAKVELGLECRGFIPLENHSALTLCRNLPKHLMTAHLQQLIGAGVLQTGGSKMTFEHALRSLTTTVVDRVDRSATGLAEGNGMDGGVPYINKRALVVEPKSSA